jgi:ribosome-associated protein YbcJ (S4-like RNA binding protein)
MSVISDALKKAQRQRSGPEGTMPPMSGGGRGRRDQPSGMSLLWIGLGVLGLVAGAVGLTVFFLRPKAAPPAPVSPAALAAAKSSAAPPAANTGAPIAAPVIGAPLVVAPKLAEPVAPAPAASASPALALATSASAVTTTSTKGAPPDARVIAFIDTLKVTGVRSSGTESKVLMNDHVYRVNDVVERMLNVRLTVVGADSLTFVDDNGVVYTKNF